MSKPPAPLPGLLPSMGLGACLAVTVWAAPSTAAAQALGPGDTQAVFETLMYRNCQRQAAGMLESFKRDIGPLPSDPPVENRICGCTVKALTETPRMQGVFDAGPDKLKTIGEDKELMEYVKRKTVALILQCTGIVIDRIVDPRK